jgi:hypothetical protein
MENVLRRLIHQHNSDTQAINIPTVSTKKKERWTQTRWTYTGSLPKPTQFDPDDPALKITPVLSRDSLCPIFSFLSSVL